MPPGQSGSRRSGNMTGTRKTQNVATLADRKRVMLWMCEKSQGGRDEKLPSRAVKQFPTAFRGDMKAPCRRKVGGPRSATSTSPKPVDARMTCTIQAAGVEACAHEI
jgi:hypothetical protein